MDAMSIFGSFDSPKGENISSGIFMSRLRCFCFGSVCICPRAGQNPGYPPPNVGLCHFGWACTAVADLVGHELQVAYDLLESLLV